MSLLETFIAGLECGRDLEVRETEILFGALVNETDETVLRRLFVAWKAKGIAEDEIYSLALTMRRLCKKVTSPDGGCVDIVGTGGSRAKTFNVSTASAFVVAGMNVPVAKHGNRAATSNSGSADVLAALGVEPSAGPADAERCLDEVGICFLFAPNFHGLSPVLGKVRRQLGFPTIFNCVGPLCNPAGASYQLIGVWDETLVSKVAGALNRLGSARSWIVHAHDGLDEVSVSGGTTVAEIAGDSVTTFEIEPGDFGVDADEAFDCRVETADESAALVRSILASERPGSSAESLVLMNAAAAFYLCGRVGDLRAGFELAEESVRRGFAAQKLEQLAAAVRK